MKENFFQRVTNWLTYAPAPVTLDKEEYEVLSDELKVFLQEYWRWYTLSRAVLINAFAVVPQMKEAAEKARRGIQLAFQEADNNRPRNKAKRPN